MIRSKYVYQILLASSVILYFCNLNYFIYHIIGILCFLLFHQGKLKNNLNNFLLIGFAFISLKFMGIYTFIIFCSLVLLINFELLGINFKNRWVLLLSKSTYSMYLIQVLTLPFFIKLLKNSSFFDDYIMTSFYRIFIYIFGLGITIISGIFLFKTIELPINNFLKKRFSQKIH